MGQPNEQANCSVINYKGNIVGYATRCICVGCGKQRDIVAWGWLLFVSVTDVVIMILSLRGLLRIAGFQIT